MMVSRYIVIQITFFSLYFRDYAMIKSSGIDEYQSNLKRTLILNSIDETPICPECISVPLLLNNDGDIDQTWVIANPGDNFDSVAKEACLSVKADHLSGCILQVSSSLDAVNYIRVFQEEWNAVVNDSIIDIGMSRHEFLTVIKRLRRFPAPRRLLVIGGSDADNRIWSAVNGKKEGGYTCFMNKRFLSGKSFITYDGIFSSSATDIENSISVMKFNLSGSDHNEDNSNYSHIPWDIVVLYDLCDEGLMSRSDIEFNGVSILKKLCLQSYFEYSVQRLSDDGYLFLPSFPGINESTATLKFLYSNQILPHLGSRSPVWQQLNTTWHYYTSVESGSMTIAGKTGFILSDYTEDNMIMMRCIRIKFLQGYNTLLSSPNSYRNLYSGPPSIISNYNQSYIYGDLSELREKAITLMRGNNFSRVIVILFCCRRRYTSILQRYLSSNLVSHGGMIDHVVLFPFGTADDDTTYPKLLGSLPGFVEGNGCESGNFGCAYKGLGAIDKDALFIKIDDDVLFISNGAIEGLVIEKLTASFPSFVHGNGVNHLHSPYLHQLMTAEQHMFRSTCNNSKMVNRERENPDFTQSFRRGYNINYPTLAQKVNVDMVFEPVEDSYSFYGRDWQSSSKANSQHHLFLDKIAMKPFLGERQYWFERFDLNDCKCRRPQPGVGYCSDLGYYRTSINLVLFAWSDIRDHMDLLEINDEIAISVLIPERSGMHQLISGRALYSHAAFTPQRLSQVSKFDEKHILDRYHSLADAYLCKILLRDLKPVG